LPSKALIIFGPSHVRVYELDGTTLLEEWEYSTISSFTRMDDGWVMVVGDLFKPEVYTFQSPWVRLPCAQPRTPPLADPANQRQRRANTQAREVDQVYQRCAAMANGMA
jgi:hypothetical protein